MALVPGSAVESKDARAAYMKAKKGGDPSPYIDDRTLKTELKKDDKKGKK